MNFETNRLDFFIKKINYQFKKKYSNHLLILTSIGLDFINIIQD
jgi:hypothetical protein